MRGKIVAIIGALMLLGLLILKDPEVEEFNPHSAITEEENVDSIWLQVELFNWGSNESVSWDSDGSEIDVYFQICVEFEGDEPECIDSRVWSNASSIDSPDDVDLGTGLTAVAVTAGYRHTCAILDNGDLNCWGYDYYGQLGNGVTTTASQTSPDTVDLGTGRTAVAVAVGADHTCSILDNGDLKCWGSDYSGQLGNGATTSDDQTSPAAVDLGMGRTAIAISAGYYHTCAILDNGDLKCWGSDNAKQLGTGETTGKQDSPVAVDLGIGHTAVAVAAGADHTCAILDNGDLKCWGGDYEGQLGNGATTSAPQNSPAAVDLGTGRTAVAVTAGDRHTCAILDNGELKCWGDDYEGQLGNGATMSDDQTSPDSVDLGMDRTAVAVTAGHRHTCAILDNGELKCWGYDYDGQLGNGANTSASQTSPEAVDLGTGRTAVAVTAGYRHTCAILDNGDRKCWGSDGHGQLGNGANTSASQTSPDDVIERLGKGAITKWSAVHFIDNELAGFNLTMECIDFDAYKDNETQKCDMSSSPGQNKIWFSFSPSDESDTRNFSGEIHTQTPTNTDEYNTWTHWGISALTLNDDNENGVPNLWEHCNSPVLMSDWNQLVSQNCPPSPSLDSDMDGFSDLIEVKCYSDFEDYNNTPSYLDDDSICGAVLDSDNVLDVMDSDNDSVLDVVDSCPNTQTEYFYKTELDLDGDGCYSIYADSDLDGDGIRNEQDACKTIASKKSSIGVGDGCPGPKQYHIGYLIAGILILWVSATHYNRLSNSMALAIANRSNPSYNYTSRHTAKMFIDEVSKMDKMPTKSIIKLARQFGIDEKGERRKKEIISKAINIAVQNKRVDKAKLYRGIMTFFCLFLVSSWVFTAAGAFFLDDNDEEIILENSIFHPTHWDTSDYQHYKETGISASDHGMVSSEPVEFIFGSNWTTHKVLFESYITTDCTKREVGGYTIQGDDSYLGKSATHECEFSVTMPLNAGGKITILTEEGRLDGWFLAAPSIDVFADGESIASGSTDESRIVQGRTSAIFVKSGYHTLEIDANLFSNGDRFHIVGIEVTGLNRGLLIDETDVQSLNAEIMNGENFSRQLENLNEIMMVLKIIILCAAISRYLYTSKNGAKDNLSPNHLIILNQQLMLVNTKIAKLPPKIARGKIVVLVSRLDIHELIFLADVVDINIWNQKDAPSGVPTTREQLLRSKKYELVDWFYTVERLHRTHSKEPQKRVNVLDSYTKAEIANLLYPMIQKIGLKRQVTDELVKHNDPIKLVSWVQSQPWDDGKNKKIKMPTGESISHTFPLKCGDKNLSDEDAIFHVIHTAYKATKGVKKQQVEEIFQHPLVLLGTNCTMSGCKSKIHIRTIPMGTIKISAK